MSHYQKKIEEFIPLLPEENKEPFKLILKEYENADARKRVRLEIEIMERIDDLLEEAPEKEWELKAYSILTGVNEKELITMRKEKDSEAFKTKDYSILAQDGLEVTKNKEKEKKIN